MNDVTLLISFPTDNGRISSCPALPAVGTRSFIVGRPESREDKGQLLASPEQRAAYKAIFLRSPPRTDCTARGRCSRIRKAGRTRLALPRPPLFETIFLLNLPSLKVTRTTGGESELLQPPSLLVHLFTAASSEISFEEEAFLLYSFRILPHRIFTKETGAPIYLIQPTAASSHDNAMQC